MFIFVTDADKGVKYVMPSTRIVWIEGKHGEPTEIICLPVSDSHDYVVVHVKETTEQLASALQAGNVSRCNDFT